MKCEARDDNHFFQLELINVVLLIRHCLCWVDEFKFSLQSNVGVKRFSFSKLPQFLRRHNFSLRNLIELEIDKRCLLNPNKVSNAERTALI